MAIVSASGRSRSQAPYSAPAEPRPSISEKKRGGLNFRPALWHRELVDERDAEISTQAACSIETPLLAMAGAMRAAALSPPRPSTTFSHEKFRSVAKMLVGCRSDVRRSSWNCLWLKMSQFWGPRRHVGNLMETHRRQGYCRQLSGSTGRDESNPGADTVRVVLVQAPASIREALERTISVLR